MKLRNKMLAGLLAGMLSVSVTAPFAGAFTVKASDSAVPTAAGDEIIKNDETGIPDKNLYDVLLEKGDTNQDGVMTKQEVEEVNITSGLGIMLDAANKSISNLKGIEYFRKLNWVNLDNNQIVDVTPLSKIPYLQWISLNNNQIQDITSFNTFDHLWELYLSNNKITDISSLIGHKELYRLNVSNNLITDISPLLNMENEWQSLKYDGNPIKQPETPKPEEPQPDTQKPNTSVSAPQDTTKHTYNAVEKPVVSAKEFDTLIEENKTKDVVIESNGVTFTFAKGTMKAVAGMDKYDFGTTFISEFTKAGEMGSVVDASNYVARINFNYSGKLPAQASVKVYVGEKFAGKTLYYSQIVGNRFRHIMSAKVEQNGYITLKQDHCSDYVLTTEKVGVDIPKTGDTSNMFFYLMICVACICGVAVVEKRKCTR